MSKNDFSSLKERIGNEIRAEIKNAGLETKFIAHEIGRSVSGVNRMLKGNRMSFDMLISISRVLFDSGILISFDNIIYDSGMIANREAKQKTNYKEMAYEAIRDYQKAEEQLHQLRELVRGCVPKPGHPEKRTLCPKVRNLLSLP